MTPEQPCSSIPPLTQTLAELRAQFATHVILKATTASGRIVGSVRGQLGDGTCHVGGLAVDPEWQGRGIGTCLMRVIGAEFPQAGWFELFSGHLSEGNLRLYRRLGCRPFRQAHVRPGLTLVYLEKRKGEGAVDGCGTEPR